MKMAEYDYELRENRANQRVLKLLEDTTVDFVDYGVQHKKFDVLQFEIFDTVRECHLSYVTCREAVEYGMKLLMTLGDVGVDTFLETVQRLRMLMFDNIHPLEIRNDIALHLRAVLNNDNVNDVLIIDCIEQFMKVFAAKETDNSIYYL